MTLEAMPPADFSGVAAPDVLVRYLRGEVYDGTPGSMRTTERMSLFMAGHWVAAYERLPEVFVQLSERVGLAAGSRSAKNDKAILSFFRRTFGTDAQVANALFGVDERHFSAFRMDSTVDYAKALLYSDVSLELVEELRTAYGEPLVAQWPSSTMKKDFPDSAHARALVRTVTKSKRGYGLIRGGVSVESVTAFEAYANRAFPSSDDKYNALAETAYMGVPVTYAVAAIMAGLVYPEQVLLAYRENLAPEYLTAMA